MKGIILTSLVLLMAVGGYSQTIKGTVKDAEGEILPFATVTLQDMKKSVTADAKGTYMFRNVPEGKHTLELSFVGYETQKKEINVSGDCTEDFTLNEVNIGLNEVVVLPEGENLAYYLFNQVITNRKKLSDLVSSYTGVSTCRIETLTDLKAFPKSKLNTLNFIMALVGYKKIMVCMENHPDLRIEMAKDVSFNDGKIKASDTRITYYHPDSLTENERAAFAKKDFDMDKSAFDEVYNDAEKLKNKVDKYMKKNNLPKDSLFSYSGCYSEGNHIIHVINSKWGEIHIINGLWQIRRYIYKEEENEFYYEFQELAPNVYLPVSVYDAMIINFNRKGALDKKVEEEKQKDTSELSKRKQKKHDKRVAMLERISKNPQWKFIHTGAYNYDNIVTR